MTYFELTFCIMRSFFSDLLEICWISLQETTGHGGSSLQHSPEEAGEWGLWKVWGRLRIHACTRSLRDIEWDPLQFSFLLLWITTLSKSSLREDRVLLSLEIIVQHWGKSGQEVKQEPRSKPAWYFSWLYLQPRSSDHSQSTAGTLEDTVR